MQDLIDRQAAIDAARNWYEGLICGSFKGLEKRLQALPSAQPEWGKPVGDGRPLADSEVIPRLQAIKAQIGGSYAIERAIEVLEGLRGEQDGNT